MKQPALIVLALITICTTSYSQKPKKPSKPPKPPTVAQVRDAQLKKLVADAKAKKWKVKESQFQFSMTPPSARAPDAIKEPTSRWKDFHKGYCRAYGIFFPAGLLLPKAQWATAHAMWDKHRRDSKPIRKAELKLRTKFRRAGKVTEHEFPRTPAGGHARRIFTQGLKGQVWAMGSRGDQTIILVWPQDKELLRLRREKRLLRLKVVMSFTTMAMAHRNPVSFDKHLP